MLRRYSLVPRLRRDQLQLLCIRTHAHAYTYTRTRTHTHSANVLVIFEFLLLLLLGIVAFIVATLYSAGLSVTCDAFRKYTEDNE